MKSKPSFHLAKVGIAGSLITLACCLGFGPMLALLAAIGAGFLINDAILAPILAAFLALGLVGLLLSRRLHRRWGPVGVHAVSSASVFIFTFVAYFQPLIWLGVAGLLAAAIWNFFLRRSRGHSQQTSREATQPEKDNE